MEGGRILVGRVLLVEAVIVVINLVVPDEATLGGAVVVLAGALGPAQLGLQLGEDVLPVSLPLLSPALLCHLFIELGLLVNAREGHAVGVYFLAEESVLALDQLQLQLLAFEHHACHFLLLAQLMLDLLSRKPFRDLLFYGCLIDSFVVLHIAMRL